MWTEPAAAEIDSWKSLPFNESEFLAKEVGSARLTGEPDRMVLERVWSRPTLEVHGIAGGFTGAGAKTVIPAKATAKVSFRLVPNQTPEKVSRPGRSSWRTTRPAGIRTEVRCPERRAGHGGESGPSRDRGGGESFRADAGTPTVFIRSGGSIPIVGEFANHLGIPTILMGFGLPDDGLHSPNEKYKVANYYTGIMTVAHFLDLYGQS